MLDISILFCIGIQFPIWININEFPSEVKCWFKNPHIHLKYISFLISYFDLEAFIQPIFMFLYSFVKLFYFSSTCSQCRG